MGLKMEQRMEQQMEPAEELFATVFHRAAELFNSGGLTHPFNAVMVGANGALLALRVVAPGAYVVTTTVNIPGPMAAPVAILLHDAAGHADTLIIAETPNPKKKRDDGGSDA